MSRVHPDWDEVVGFLDTPSNFVRLAFVLLVIWVVALRLWGAEHVEQAFTALGFLVGGFWVLYQFVLRRSFESADPWPLRVHPGLRSPTAT
jgi:hypothetical protein